MGIKLTGLTTLFLSATIGMVIGVPLYVVQQMHIENILLCSSGTGGIKIPEVVCESYLTRLRGTPEDIERLSQGAGLAYILANSDNKKRFRHADFLITKGLSVDGINHYTTGKLTPLHCAILAKDINAVNYLLSKGASLEAREIKNNQTPLEFAQQLAKAEKSPEIAEIMEMLSPKNTPAIEER